MRLTRLSETDPRRRRKFSIAKQFARYSGGTKSGAVSILAHFRLSALYRTNPAVDAGWLPVSRQTAQKTLRCQPQFPKHLGLSRPDLQSFVMVLYIAINWGQSSNRFTVKYLPGACDSPRESCE